MARAGNMVVIDDVLENEPPWLENLLELFEGLDVVFVGVHCPLSELEEREKVRGNRPAGMARKQFDQVHSVAEYDIEVDTALLSTEECAQEILDYLRQVGTAAAFERMRRKSA